MDRGLEIVADGGFVRVTLHGEIDWAASERGVAGAVRRAREAGVGSILFDMRDAVHPSYHGLVLRQAANATASGIASFRVAVLGRHDDPMLPFLEDVAVNRGLRARAFYAEAHALDWLRRPPAQRSA